MTKTATPTTPTYDDYRPTMETRLVAAVRRALATDAVTLDHWLRRATGDVPVFRVPAACVTRATTLGLTVAEEPRS